MNSPILRVASSSQPYLVAGAIAGQIRANGLALTQTISTNAVYCMLKAAIIAQQYVTDDGLHLTFVLEFVEATVGDEARTAVRLRIRTRMAVPANQWAAPFATIKRVCPK